MVKVFLSLCFLGDDSVEVNTVVGKLELRNNLFDINQNNSLCNLISRSHLVYLDLSYCSLEGEENYLLVFPKYRVKRLLRFNLNLVYPSIILNPGDLLPLYAE